MQHGSPFSESQQEWQRLDLTLQHTHMRATPPPLDPALSPSFLPIVNITGTQNMCSAQKTLPLARGAFSTLALVFKPLQDQTGSE